MNVKESWGGLQINKREKKDEPGFGRNDPFLKQKAGKH